MPAEGLTGRRIGTALVAFGGVGLALVVGLLVATLLTLGPLVTEAAALADQRTHVIRMLAPAADALEATARTAGNAGTSLGRSEAVIRDAGTVTRQLADALNGLAAFSGAFSDTAQASRSLSDNLTATADAIHRNAEDGATVAQQLNRLALELRSLQDSLGPDTGVIGDAGLAVGVPLLFVLSLLLLLWLAAAAATCLWFGRRIRRATQAPPAAPPPREPPAVDQPPGEGLTGAGRSTDIDINPG